MSTAITSSESQAGFISGDAFYPRSQILTNAARAATGLASLSVGAGDCVAFLMRNDVPILELTIGAGLLGAVTVPINWHFKGAEVEYILKDSGASVLVAHADLIGPIRDGIPASVHVITVDTPEHIGRAYGVAYHSRFASQGDLRWLDWIGSHDPWDGPPQDAPTSLIYTSGTTGRPKGVRRQALTPDQRAAFASVARQTLGLTAGSTTIITAPMYHSAPNATAMFALQSGATAVLQSRFDAEDLLRLIDRHKITAVQLVPTMFVQLLNLPDETRHRYDLSTLVHVVHTAAPCPPDVKRRMIEWWGPVIYEFYGSTETGAVTFCSSEEWLAHPGTVGRPVDGATVKILGPDRQELPVGDVGDVYSRLHAISEFTYHGGAVTPEQVDSLVPSGDVGYLDQDGFLHVCDRKVDLVILGGTNVYPAEIESALGGMPDVADCAVFGIPDDRLGEVLAAVIQLTPGSSAGPDDIRAFLRQHIANFKIPKIIEFRAELPREDSGKIFKRRLRDAYWQGRGRTI
jgi:long-chain acyl-CoA synthetase